MPPCDRRQPAKGNPDSARRLTAGRSLTGALRRVPLLPVINLGRAGGGGVRLALGGRPAWAVTPALTELAVTLSRGPPGRGSTSDRPNASGAAAVGPGGQPQPDEVASHGPFVRRPPGRGQQDRPDLGGGARWRLPFERDRQRQHLGGSAGGDGAGPGPGRRNHRPARSGSNDPPSAATPAPEHRTGRRARRRRSRRRAGRVAGWTTPGLPPPGLCRAADYAERLPAGAREGVHARGLPPPGRVAPRHIQRLSRKASRSSVGR